MSTSIDDEERGETFIITKISSCQERQTGKSDRRSSITNAMSFAVAESDQRQMHGLGDSQYVEFARRLSLEIC